MSFHVRLMFRLLPLVLVSFASLAQVTSYATAPEPDSPRLVFATAEVWPWGFRGADGAPDGSLVQFTNRLAAATNLPLVNELRPHRRAIAELASGTVDFAVLYDSPDNNAIGVPVESLLTVQVILAGRAGEDYPLSLDGLAGREVAFIRGTYYGEAFHNDKGMEKVPVAGLAQALEMLRLGRVDAIVASDQALYRTLQAQGLDPGDLRTNVVSAEQKAYLYMSRKARFPELLEPVRLAVRRMRETGELDAIFRLTP